MQFQAIHIDHLVRVLFYIRNQVDMFLLCNRTYRIQHRLQEAAAVGILRLQFHLPAFYAGQIKRIIYKVQKQITGQPDPFEILLLHRRIRFLKCNIRKSQNSIERCPQIMAHTGKEC